MTETGSWLARRFPQGSFVRNVAVLGTGTALGQLVALGAYPILTRLYTREQFGILTVYAAALAIVATVASLRYDLAIPLPEQDRDGRDLLTLSLVLVAAISGIAAIVVVAFPGAIAGTLGSQDVRPYLWLLPLGILGAGTFQALSYWAIRVREFGVIARAKVMQSIGMAATQLAAGVISGGTAGLLVGDIVGRSAGSGRLGLLPRRRHVPHATIPLMARVRAVALRYRRFPVYSTIASLLNSSGLRVPALLITAFYGLDIGGLFGLTLLVFAVPITLVSRSVSQVYLSEAADLARTSPDGLARLFRGTARRLALLGVVPVVVLVVAGPWLFELVFGDEWRMAGDFARYLAPMLLGQFVVAPLSQTLNVLERQSWQLGWDATRLVLAVGSFVLADNLGWSVAAAVQSYGLAMFVAYGLLLWLNATAIRVGSTAS